MGVPLLTGVVAACVNTVSPSAEGRDCTGVLCNIGFVQNSAGAADSAGAWCFEGAESTLCDCTDACMPSNRANSGALLKAGLYGCKTADAKNSTTWEQQVSARQHTRHT